MGTLRPVVQLCGSWCVSPQAWSASGPSRSVIAQLDCCAAFRGAQGHRTATSQAEASGPGSGFGGEEKLLSALLRWWLPAAQRLGTCSDRAISGPGGILKEDFWAEQENQTGRGSAVWLGRTLRAEDLDTPSRGLGPSTPRKPCLGRRS